MTFKEFWQPLTTLYDESEARWIGRLVMELGYGLSTTDIVTGGVEHIDQVSLTDQQQRLLGGEPVQYVVGRAPFGQQLFAVGPGVLIPRPETLWLCRAAEQHLCSRPSTVLDIGTGSGCIAITIALDSPGASVTGWDISLKALTIARSNALSLNASVSFEHQDALCLPAHSGLWDVIVSNPPYICQQERADMERHVVDFEPAHALFVPDDDPLLFYRSIGRYAIAALRPDGRLYFEINPLYAEALSDMLRDLGFSQISIHQDDFGKDRYIIAQR